MTFALATVDVEPVKRGRKNLDALRIKDIPADIEAGLALMLGRNSEGHIRVFARNPAVEIYTQVGLFAKYELALEHVRQMKADEAFRKSEIRDAKRREPFKA